MEGVEWGPVPPEIVEIGPKIKLKQAMKSKRFLSEVDLYHNPDPLFRLVGKPNESEIFIDNQKVMALIDSGAQLSSITNSLAKTLKLDIKNLKTILDLEGTGGLLIPYLGQHRNMIENSQGQSLQ